MKTLFVVFCLVFVAAANVVPNRLVSACSNVNPSPAYFDCYVDLTIAMDMSSAMANTANIATMTNSILTDFLPSFNFYDTFTAGLSFGSTVTFSMYWNNYADMCNYIHSAEEQAVQVGLNNASLSQVFQNYRIDLEYSGRNYQKVLVLLTAKSDPTEIAAAKVYADQIMAQGVAIIVVALAQDSTSPLSQLGQHFYSTPGYAIPITTVPNVVCSYGGQTMVPPSVDPSALPYDPLSDAVGTPCSTNLRNLWLDIVFVTDISNSMDHELTAWAGETVTYMYNVTFGPRGPHKTRAGLITYGTDSVTRLALSDGISTDVFQDAMFDVSDYYNDDDNGGYLQNALKAAAAMLNETKLNDGNPKDIRKQVIILTSAAYSEVGFKGAKDTAKILKNDGVYIFTVNYKSKAGVPVPGLDELASEGYAFQSDDHNLPNLITLGLTQVNCFCPDGSIQFQYFNGHNKTNYADCIFFQNEVTLPPIVLKKECPKGSPLSMTSQIKLDFITDNYNSTNDISQFIVGAAKGADGNWYWHGYNNATYPVGRFPVFNPLQTDTYSYMENDSGYNWRLVGTTPFKSLPYFCQNRACDADFICDQTKI